MTTAMPMRQIQIRFKKLKNLIYIIIRSLNNNINYIFILFLYSQTGMPKTLEKALMFVGLNPIIEKEMDSK